MKHIQRYQDVELMNLDWLQRTDEWDSEKAMGKTTCQKDDH